MRSLYTVLRDHVRNGIHYTDLRRLLGEFRISKTPNPADRATASEPSDLDLESGEFAIHYPIRTWSVLVELRLQNGRLVGHDPKDFDRYTTAFRITAHGLEPVTRPLDAIPDPADPNWTHSDL